MKTIKTDQQGREEELVYLNRWGNSLDLEGLRAAFPNYRFTEGRTLPFEEYLPYRVAHSIPPEESLTPAVKIREKVFFGCKSSVAYRLDTIVKYTTDGSGKPLASADCRVQFDKSLGDTKLEEALRETIAANFKKKVEKLVAEGYEVHS